MSLTYKPTSARQRSLECTGLHEAVIDGLLRRGEVMNVIAPPKYHKSWLVLHMALAVASGKPVLNQFPVVKGKVLILDNELHNSVIDSRIPVVAQAMGLTIDDYGDRLFIQCLRGNLKNWFELGEYFDGIQHNDLSLIICDAAYRFLPKSCDENSNSDIASIYNTIDRYASQTGSAFALIHHTSKGNQQGKGNTDVGSGAGAQSRAADAHLTIREHPKDASTMVLEASVRSWKPVAPIPIKWSFPLWERASEPVAEPKHKKPVLSLDTFVTKYVTREPRPKQAILLDAISDGMSERGAARLLDAAVGSLVKKVTEKGITTYAIKEYI